MRVPLSWLKEYISLSLKPDEIAKILTMAGLEVDSWESVGEGLQGIVVGRVVESTKHPNADKLSVAVVTDGKETYQVVCGAPNCRAGLKTAFAKVGAVLKSGDQEITIRQAKIRGVESFGMLCSPAELGISESDEGIIEFPQELKEGMPLSDLYGDTLFEISLTPNLSHCNSLWGVARELSALIEHPLQYPNIAIQESDDPVENSLHVTVMDKADCPRYGCRVIKDVRVGPSPDWLKQRLEKCGVRSVNNIVDATNYVTLELGHPLHAFDYDKLESNELIIRKAKTGELLLSLDGKERKLQDTMLLICDKSKPAAIAGVMGGLDSEIKAHTRHVVLESAYFDPMSIRRSSKQLALQTDASKRFERGTDPNLLLFALDRAAQLIQQVAGGTVLAGKIDVQAKEFPPLIVTCRLSRINQLLGGLFSRGEAENTFKRLQFPYQWDGHDQFTVHVPTYRNDIRAEIDLIEEVARLYGYEHLPRQGGRYQASTIPVPALYLFEKEVRARLIGTGLQEFLTCDLIGPTLLQIIQNPGLSPESMVSVLNPTSIEQSILRTSLLPGLLQVVKHNMDRQNQRIAGFELGNIHFRDGEDYREQPVVGIILCGPATSYHWDQPVRQFDLFDLKGIVEVLLGALGIPQPVYQNIDLSTFHAGRQASLFINSLEIGSIGEIHPAIQRRLDVAQRILFGEFNLGALRQVAKPLEKVKPLAIYPGSERDWTMTIKENIPLETVLEVIRAQNCAILDAVLLKSIYRSEKLPEGYQNMTLHFVYRDPHKTVEQENVDAEHHRLVAAVLQQLGASIIL